MTAQIPHRELYSSSSISGNFFGLPFALFDVPEADEDASATLSFVAGAAADEDGVPD
jgi:hypothetical protein